jgi:hypothetical protein
MTAEKPKTASVTNDHFPLVVEQESEFGGFKVLSMIIGFTCRTDNFAGRRNIHKKKRKNKKVTWI